LISSCSNKIPSLKDPEKGIIAIRVEASNTSRMGMIRYFKIYPNTNTDLIITIFPQEGKTFVYSPPLPPGEYDFNRVKAISDERHGYSVTGNYDVRPVYAGNYIKVQPGTVTIARKKMRYKQYEVQPRGGDWASRAEWDFDYVFEEELIDLIKELRNVDSNNQWKIAHEDLVTSN
jgi:hypothetical protein